MIIRQCIKGPGLSANMQRYPESLVLERYVAMSVVNGGSAVHMAYQGDVPTGEFIMSR